MNWKIASATGEDLSPADASATKVYGSELATQVYRSLMEVVGPNSVVHADSPATVVRGRLERYYRSSLVMTFGGGTNEIQRDIIGMVGLGLPPAAADVADPRTRRPMDFTPTAGQSDVEPLAARILGDRCTPDRLAAVEAGGDRFDRELWAELGAAGLLGIAVPEAYDGAGLGLLELTTVLVEAGKVVAPVPLATHAVASLALARWAGSDLARHLAAPRRRRARPC